MTSVKNIERLSLQADSNNNNLTKSVLNLDINHLKQDLLFFKNDILKDLRKIEEKVNIKLTEQSVANNEQYEAYERKLDALSTKISHVNTVISDNSFIIEKLNKFQSFKSKAEDNLYSLNSRINNIQQESKDSLIRIEKILEDNLNYPGIIGKNSKFSNLRFFIDFVMNNIKLLNSFKEEIQSFEFTEFKNKINSDLNDFRFLIDDEQKNIRKLIENNIKNFDIKHEELINNSNRTENKLKEFKIKINEKFSEYEKNINLLEKDLNKKYNDQLNEINHLKNEFTNDIDNIKNNLSKNQKLLDYLKNLTEKNILLQKMNENNSLNYLADNQFILGEKNENIQFKNSLFEKKKENEIHSALNIHNRNKNVNILDNKINQKSEEKPNSNNTLIPNTNMLMNKMDIIEYSKSFDKTQNNGISHKNYYFDEHNEFQNTKENLAFTQDDFFPKRQRKQENYIQNSEIKKSIPRMHLNKYSNLKNNYSIINIPNIKVKKVALPENLNHRNKLVKIPKSSFIDNKRRRVTRNSNPSLLQRYFFQNNEVINNTNNFNKNTVYNNNNFNITKINKIQSSKMRNNKLVDSARIINRKSESKKTENLKSLDVIQTKNKNSLLTSTNNLKQSKIRNWSFEKKENKEIEEKTQVLFGNTFNAKNHFKEILLVNTKNLKKNRKIKM